MWEREVQSEKKRVAVNGTITSALLTLSHGRSPGGGPLPASRFGAACRHGPAGRVGLPLFLGGPRRSFFRQARTLCPGGAAGGRGSSKCRPLGAVLLLFLRRHRFRPTEAWPPARAAISARVG